MIFDWTGGAWVGDGIGTPPFVPVPPAPYVPDVFTKWLYRAWWTVPQTDDTPWATFFSNILLEFIHFLTGTFVDVETGAFPTVDLELGRNFTVTLDEDKLLTLTHPIAGARYIFVVVQSGNYSLAFSNTIKWPGGTVPDVTHGAGSVDVITLVYHADEGYLGIAAQGMA